MRDIYLKAKSTASLLIFANTIQTLRQVKRKEKTPFHNIYIAKMLGLALDLDLIVNVTSFELRSKNGKNGMRIFPNWRAKFL